MFTKALSLLAFSLVVGTTSAQITYLPGTEITEPVWTSQAQPVEQGNGVYISPDGALAVVVSRDASVKAINSINGEDVWMGPVPPATAQSFGGAFFCSSQYILYSYVDTATNVSTAVALSPTDGSMMKSFSNMQGVVAGTPVSTEDCQYVMATHNVDGSKGFFSVFSYTAESEPLLTYEHPVIANEPFSALGYYWSPLQGNYPGGEGNTNDVFIWSFDTNLNINNATVGTEQVFGFQLPTNPNSPLNVTEITGDRDYQARTAPVLTDGGLSMYWSVSRSKVYAWVGDGNGRTDFTTNGVGNYAFERETMPFSAPPLTTPSLSNGNATGGFVVGTSAVNQIWRGDRNFSSAAVVVETVGLITSRLLVSPDNTFVYYATPTPDASLYQVTSTDLSQSWKITLTGGVVGDIAQTKNGARIIVADQAGSISAFAVATADEALMPVSAPPVAPTVPTVSAPVPASGPTVTMSPSETSGPSSTVSPSTTRSPIIPGAPTAPTVPSVPSAPSAPTAPSAPKAPSALSPSGKPPSAPTSDAMAWKTVICSFVVVVVATSITMMA